ncbi:AMP-dependent synthetase/ligase [Macrophomina phaseolina MS6]|uniref:AMP-dependent synthetase/ligase n=1 Tax=Macrophomina phaseolina (strain MS6) TaxID=1126212 RepID=K2QX73_MACPH|nr:AMP-dependent synthetase/ligase [Macrophomina phaseolina MS6]
MCRAGSELASGRPSSCTSFSGSQLRRPRYRQSHSAFMRTISREDGAHRDGFLCSNNTLYIHPIPAFRFSSPFSEYPWRLFLRMTSEHCRRLPVSNQKCLSTLGMLKAGHYASDIVSNPCIKNCRAPYSCLWNISTQ